MLALHRVALEGLGVERDAKARAGGHGHRAVDDGKVPQHAVILLGPKTDDVMWTREARCGGAYVQSHDIVDTQTDGLRPGGQPQLFEHNRAAHGVDGRWTTDDDVVHGIGAHMATALTRSTCSATGREMR